MNERVEDLTSTLVGAIADESDPTIVLAALTHAMAHVLTSERDLRKRLELAEALEGLLGGVRIAVGDLRGQVARN
jgi:hypothetical protein